MSMGLSTDDQLNIRILDEKYKRHSSVLGLGQHI